MLKKLLLAVIVVGIGVLCYTEKTGKTHLSDTVYSFVLGEEPPKEDDSVHYTLAKEKEQLSDAEQAKKDASEYHKKEKRFANAAKDTANGINEASK